MDRTIVNPWQWQDKFGFVQANSLTGVERTVLCAGQTSSDADGNPVHAGDMPAQVRQALDNLETVLGQAGLGLGGVVRLVPAGEHVARRRRARVSRVHDRDRGDGRRLVARA